MPENPEAISPYPPGPANPAPGPNPPGPQTPAVESYTSLPGTLPEAQQMIVRLMDEQKAMAASASERLRALNEATAMVVAARVALNAVERPD